LKKKTLPRLHPYTGSSEGFLVEKMKTLVESMVKGMLRMKAQ